MAEYQNLRAGNIQAFVKIMKKELSKLELEFQEVSEKIQEKINIACAALDEAVALSEEHGLPFRPPISFLGQGYKPSSFEEEKWSSLKAMEYDIEDFEYEGWQHSDIC